MKPNPMLAKIQAQHKADMQVARKITMQFVEDMAVIANNRVFHAGPMATEKFLLALWDVMTEYSEMVLDDTDDGIYSKAKLDEILEPIMGHNYKPYHERYGYTPTFIKDVKKK